MTSDTTTYTRPDGTPYDERQAEVIDEQRADLLSGAYFARHVISYRSVIGYQPPTRSDHWGYCMQVLGEMAQRGDRFAQIARRIFGRVNLYGTGPECAAQVYEAADAALAAGYDDVLGRSGPEAGRPSDHKHAYSLATRVELAYWLTEATSRPQWCNSVPGVGWCVDAIARAEHIHIPPAARRHEERRSR